MKDCGFRFHLRRASAILLLLMIVPALLCGCVKKYVQSDIKSYAKKLTGRNNLSVSDGYVEIQEDEEGYLDHLWTVRDDDNGVVFHILDDYYWALEEVQNQLLNDYDSSVFLWLLDNSKIPETKGLYLKKSAKSGLTNAEVICSFSDENSLKELYEELLSLRKAAEEEGFNNLKVKYTVQYQHPLRNAVEYETDEGDTTGQIGSLNEDAYAQMRKNYLACALDYRFEDVLSGVTEEEIDAIVNAPDSVRLYKSADGSDAGSTGMVSQLDESNRVYYEGVTGNPQYAGISFGTLYELLRIEGFSVQGNAWHYSFTSPDGSLIEISYDFNDLSGFNDKNGKLRKGYYYNRDDRKVRMKNYYATHFDTTEIRELTGLQVYEDRPYVVETDEEKEAEK